MEVACFDDAGFIRGLKVGCQLRTNGAPNRPAPVFMPPLYDAAGGPLAFLWHLQHILHWTNQEAVMAATTFSAGDRSAGDRSGRVLAPELARDALLPNLRGIFDALAGERPSQAAMEAGQPRGSESDQDSQAAQHASFGPLDPNILSESIAAFFIGRNADGFWVARERSGRIGGIFILKSSAVSFAHRHAGDAACATIFPEGSLELDIENNGNRLVGLIGPLVRACKQARLREQQP